ncbi:hypothetical protein PG993_010975 [Apiospora rasikravindrae]|uniref:Heterokaryon incompatibility domain-containing protein n=1 Tax=Apiospora rasikravindrae TaxID=990691 RepID=A0ABR1SEN1_9PEZI
MILSTCHSDAEACSNGKEAEEKVQFAGKRTFSGIPFEEDSNGLGVEPPMHHPKRIKQCVQDAIPTEEINNGYSFGEVICDECLKLDLQGILQEVVATRNYTIKTFGYRSRLAYNTDCPLCQIIAVSCLTAKGKHHSEELGDQEEKYEVVAVRYMGWTGLDLHYKRKPASGPVCLMLDPGGVLGPETRQGGVFFSANGGTILRQDTIDPTLFSPQIIPRDFDPGTAKTWLDYCTKHHKRLCASGMESVHGLQVIDCATLSVENGRPESVYVALSYVWAKSGGACGSIREEDGKKRLPETLSAVVRDSIKVTQALGYRYLWVDKFCIDQNNPSLKHDQIQQMDAIYRNSALTIISAAGVDETYGLPGVSSRARRQQLVIRHQGLTVIQAPKDPQTSIASSHWSTRGWTFQEALLSRRRLVFTDDQMYFECNTMSCFESVHSPLDMLHIKDKFKTYENFRSGMFGRNRNERFGNIMREKISLNNFFCRYLSNVEDYSARNLGYDEDSLNAFRGVLGQYTKLRARGSVSAFQLLPNGRFGEILGIGQT